jgi:hypothetical protein
MSFRRAMLVAFSILAMAALIAAPAAGAAKGKKKKKPLGSLTVVSSIANSAGAVTPGPLSATATCPSGRALSGGFEVNGAPGSQVPEIIESSRVGDNGWRAAFLPTAEGQSLLAEVYCATKVKGAISTVTASQQLGGSTFSGAAPTASCPQGQRLISGGFQNAVGDPTDAPSAYLTENRLVQPNAWRAAFLRGLSATTADQLTVHAYCLKPPKGKKPGKGKKRKKVRTLPRALTEVATTAQTPTSEGASATATTPPCAGKLRGVAGGFTTPLAVGNAAPVVQARFFSGAWNVRVRQLVSSPGSGPFTAHEYCG